MNKQEFIETMENEWQEFGTIELEFSDGDTSTFGNGDNWVGWEENDWGCDLLGNVAYDSFDDALYATANYIYDELKEEIVNIDC